MGDHEGAGGSGGEDTAINILTKFDLSSLLRLNRTSLRQALDYDHNQQDLCIHTPPGVRA